MRPLGWRWLAQLPHQTAGVCVLQGAIGAALLFRVFTEAPFALYLWGPHGLGWGSTQHVLGPTLGGLVDRSFATEIGTLIVLLALGLGALGLLLGWRTQAATALALVAFTLLDQRLPELIDRGDTAARLALAYLLLALPPRATASPGSLAVWLHNVAVLAVAMQTMVIYATAGLMKVGGQEWVDGTALYYISQVESLSLPAMREMVKDPLFTTIGSYFTVLYETFFPLAVLSRLRLPWIVLGIAFHLAIAVFLGLVTFSTVMIGLDLFFVSDAEYARLLAFSKRVQAQAACKARP